jgi:hypothetical protein
MVDVGGYGLHHPSRGLGHALTRGGEKIEQIRRARSVRAIKTQDDERRRTLA